MNFAFFRIKHLHYTAKQRGIALEFDQYAVFD